MMPAAAQAAPLPVAADVVLPEKGQQNRDAGEQDDQRQSGRPVEGGNAAELEQPHQIAHAPDRADTEHRQGGPAAPEQSPEHHRRGQQSGGRKQEHRAAPVRPDGQRPFQRGQKQVQKQQGRQPPAAAFFFRMILHGVASQADEAQLILSYHDPYPIAIFCVMIPSVNPGQYACRTSGGRMPCNAMG